MRPRTERSDSPAPEQPPSSHRMSHRSSAALVEQLRSQFQQADQELLDQVVKCSNGNHSSSVDNLTQLFGQPKQYRVERIVEERSEGSRPSTLSNGKVTTTRKIHGSRRMLFRIPPRSERGRIQTSKLNMNVKTAAASKARVSRLWKIMKLGAHLIKMVKPVVNMRAMTM